MVTVLRTIPPIAVQERGEWERVGEMSGGDCPPYDTIAVHSSTGDNSHSSTGAESGRDVRW